MDGDTIFCEYGDRIVVRNATYTEKRGGEVVKGVCCCGMGREASERKLGDVLGRLVLPLVTPTHLEEGRRMGR